MLSAWDDVALHEKSGPRPITTNGTPGKSAPRVEKPAALEVDLGEELGKK